MREPAKKFEDLVAWQKAHQSLLSEVSKLLKAYSKAILDSEF